MSYNHQCCQTFRTTCSDIKNEDKCENEIEEILGQPECQKFFQNGKLDPVEVCAPPTANSSSEDMPPGL